jgi:hypothetical protein
MGFLSNLFKKNEPAPVEEIGTRIGRDRYVLCETSAAISVHVRNGERENTICGMEHAWDINLPVSNEDITCKPCRAYMAELVRLSQ